MHGDVNYFPYVPQMVNYNFVNELSDAWIYNEDLRRLVTKDLLEGKLYANNGPLMIKKCLQLQNNYNKTVINKIIELYSFDPIDNIDISRILCYKPQMGYDPNNKIKSNTIYARRVSLNFNLNVSAASAEFRDKKKSIKGQARPHQLNYKLYETDADKVPLYNFINWMMVEYAINIAFLNEIYKKMSEHMIEEDTVE